MQISIFLSLVAYACATTFSPGPNNVLLLSSAGQYGFRKCVPLLQGIWCGLLTVMLLCGFACSFISDLIPSIEKYARFVGALYIAYLGFRTLFRPAPKGDSPEASGQPLTRINGFLLQFLNIKILMLGVAAYCSFVLPYDTGAVPTLIYSVTMAICAACGNLIWVTCGTLLFPVYRRHFRIFNGIMALLLAWCVYKILWV